MKEADYTIEYNKVFINLASLLLGTSLIFVAQITSKDSVSLILLLFSWVFWVTSIYFGAATIGDISTLVGEAEIDDKDTTTRSFAASYISDRLNSAPFALKIKTQLYTFILGFVALIVNATIKII